MMEKIGNVEISTFGSAPVFPDREDKPENVFLLEVLKQQADPGEILKRDHRWPVMLQLSSMRRNIVQPMSIHKDSRVLELDAGMGAVTAALAPLCSQIDCVEESLLQSRANAYRNRAYDNLRIHVGSMREYQPRECYDVVVLLGGLERAPHYFPGADPFREMLAFCRKMLKPGGLVYIAVNNRLGARYFAGCREEHADRFFAGIEGNGDNQSPHAFSKSELAGLVGATGFENLFFYYPLPDYNLPRMIYSEKYLPQNDLSFPYRSNYDADRLVCFEEVALLRSLGGTAEFGMLTNSFLLEAAAQ